MNTKNNRIRIKITDNEFNEKIYDGVLGAKELGKTIKKIKKKYS